MIVPRLSSAKQSGNERDSCWLARLASSLVPRCYLAASTLVVLRGCTHGRYSVSLKLVQLPLIFFPQGWGGGRALAPFPPPRICPWRGYKVCITNPWHEKCHPLTHISWCCSCLSRSSCLPQSSFSTQDVDIRGWRRSSLTLTPFTSPCFN